MTPKKLFSLLAQLLWTLSSLSLFARAHSSSSIDKSLEDKAFGEDVVDLVLDRLHHSLIFTDDYDLLNRIALVESTFGLNPDTFRPDYYGGIWQLNEHRYNLTKDVTTYPSLTPIHIAISRQFGIDWPSSTWRQLLKPLYSILAARLYLLISNEDGQPIPQTLKNQADYWFLNYADHDEDNEFCKFIDLVTSYESGSKCRGNLDLLVVLDESGSIGVSNFEKVLQFIQNFFSTYSLEGVRQGFMTFSSPLYTIEFGPDPYRLIFGLENDLTASEIGLIVNTTRYRQGGTWTNHVIMRAIQLYRDTNERPGVPKLMTLFTDGMSYAGEGNPNVSNSIIAKNEGIQTFAIGIGNYDEKELNEIAYGDPSHVFTFNDFNALYEFSYRLHKETCKIPQMPNFTQTIEDTLMAGEKRYYLFKVGEEAGVTIFILAEGNVTGYFSYTNQNPSSASNDGELDLKLGTFFEYFGIDRTLYVTVEGVTVGENEEADYTILALEGNWTETPIVDTTTTTTTTESPIDPPTDIYECIRTVDDFDLNGWNSYPPHKYVGDVTDLPPPFEGKFDPLKDQGIFYFEGSTSQPHHVFFKDFSSIFNDFEGVVYIYLKYYAHISSPIGGLGGNETIDTATVTAPPSQYVQPIVLGDAESDFAVQLRHNDDFLWEEILLPINTHSDAIESLVETGILDYEAGDYFLIDVIAVAGGPTLTDALHLIEKCIQN